MDKLDDPSKHLQHHIVNTITIDLKMEDPIPIVKIENNDKSIDAVVTEEFIFEECLPVEHEATKIEITEHSLALENIAVLEDIYNKYNESEARDVNVSHSTKKLMKKAKSRRKKVVQTNTLDSFVYKIKGNIEKKMNSKVFPKTGERLFIRLERMDFSNKLNLKVFNSVSNEHNLATDQRKEKTVCRPTKGLALNKLHRQTKNFIAGITVDCSSTYVKYTTDDNEVPEQILGRYLPKKDRYQVKKKVGVAEYQCYHCNAVCIRRKGMVNHMNKWHKGPRKKVRKQEFQCYHCGKVVKHRKSLISHLAQWHTEGEKKFHCDSCTYKTNLKKGLLSHVYRVHTPDDQKPTFKCDFCPHVTKLKGDLRFHVNRVHLKKKKILMCDQCNWAGDSVRLPDHKKHQHSGLEFECDKCSFKTKIKANLTVHNRTHNKERPFSCPKCPYKSRYNRLSAHMKTHEFIFKKCPECFQTIKESSLRYHMRHYHRGNRRKEKCPECGKQVISLKKHLQTHNGGYTKIKCPDCSFTCTNSYYLTKHIEDCHENKKREPVTCYQCNKELVGKYSLMQHLKTVHTIDPCDCPICGTTLRSKLYLSTHLRRLHNTPVLECDLCPEGSRYKTKNKKRFAHHKVLHLTGEEVKIYKCEYCPYENKVLPNLHRHLVKHHKKQSKNVKNKA